MLIGGKKTQVIHCGYGMWKYILSGALQIAVLQSVKRQYLQNRCSSNCCVKISNINQIMASEMLDIIASSDLGMLTRIKCILKNRYDA